MQREPGGVDAVRRYLQKRIDRCNTRIARARKANAAARRRRTRSGPPAAAAVVAERRAYRDILSALNKISSVGGPPAVPRLAAEEVGRVKSALAKIYEVTQHANHDIAEAGDWTIVEGEAQAALNIMHEAERSR